MEIFLILWVLSGIGFWAKYEAHEFIEYPFHSLLILAIAVFCGPICWVAVLIPSI